jgi:hypothetical protein
LRSRKSASLNWSKDIVVVLSWSREDHHVGVANKLLERIAELEAIQSGNSGNRPQ